jgi:hypothetical protein
LGSGLFAYLKPSSRPRIQDAGVNARAARAYAAKLPGGQTSVIILNKDAVRNIDVEIDFGARMSGAVEIETLQAQTLDSRDVRITIPTQANLLKQGKCFVTIPRATGMRLILI